MWVQQLVITFPVVAWPAWQLSDSTGLACAFEIEPTVTPFGKELDLTFMGNRFLQHWHRGLWKDWAVLF